MNAMLLIFGALGAVVFLLLLIFSCLPSPTLTRLVKRFQKAS